MAQLTQLVRVKNAFLCSFALFKHLPEKQIKKNICGISMISTTEDKVKLPFQI